MADGLATAWKGTLRAVKKGYKMTKLAVVPGEVNGLIKLRSGSTDVHSGAQTHPLRQLSASVISAVDGSDDEPLTDEQVHAQVDSIYFDRSYDAMRAELVAMEVTYTDSEEEIKKERRATESEILLRRRQCDIVSTTLRKRVLLHQHAFMRGVEQIRQVNDGLLLASSECKKSRSALRKWKAVAASRVALIALHRSKTNVESTISLLGAIQRMCWKRNQLQALITGGKLADAADLLDREGGIEKEAQLQRIFCMRSVLDEWKLYRDDRTKLVWRMEEVLTSSLSSKLIPATYRNAFESSQSLGRPLNDTCSLVVSLLWRTAVQILTKALTEVSCIKDDDRSIADIAEGIDPDHLMLGVCQLCAKLMDFIYLYQTVVRLHSEESRSSSPYAEGHQHALRSVKAMGHKIGSDIAEKLTVVLSFARFACVDLDRVLHTFFVVSVLVEAVAVLGLDTQELTSARTQIKEVLVRFIHRHFQVAKATEILHFMGDDHWAASEMDINSLSVVQTLSPEYYNNAIKNVKTYCSESSSECLAAVPADNPFYSHEMLLVQDTSSRFATERFDTYRMHARSLTSGDTNSTSSIHGRPDGDTLVTDSAPTATWLVERLAESPTVLTQSTHIVANTVLEYQARVAVRYPPLAGEIIGWCEDLIGLYIYTVADNFISITRTVPIENQGELSHGARQLLTEMRTRGQRAVGVVNGSYPALLSGMTEGAGGGAFAAFPPRVWNCIRDAFVSEAQQYGLQYRVVACESCRTLILILEAAVRGVAQLLPKEDVSMYAKRLQYLYNVTTELLHVGMHRLCQAIYPMQHVCSEIEKLKPHRNEVTVSGYVSEVVSGMVDLNARRARMPTAALEVLFLRRLVFAVQATLVRAYSRLSKKLTDMLIMTMQVDVQTFQHHVTTNFGKDHVIAPEHVMRFVKTGFYMDSRDELVGWLKRYHTDYYLTDMLTWFSAGDRALKQYLDDLLGRQLHHIDTIPWSSFI